MRADGGRTICLSLDFSIQNLEKFTHLTDTKRPSVRVGLAEDSGPGIVVPGRPCVQLWVQELKYVSDGTLGR